MRRARRKDVDEMRKKRRVEMRINQKRYADIDKMKRSEQKDT